MRYLTATVLLGLCCLVTLPSFACLNDMDSDDWIRIEAKRSPELLFATIGHFPRNPPLYYKMRLKRCAALIAEHPDEPTYLNEYDNCAVACDRLGRFDEAISWMNQKKAILDQLYAMPEDERPEGIDLKEHHYRYHANLGTHIMHKWLKTGKEPQRLDEVDQAITHITKALELKPDAHYGREKFQLWAMKWIRNLFDPETQERLHAKANTKEGDDRLEAYLDADELRLFPQDLRYEMDQSELEEYRRGILGLIMLGAAWESYDIHRALHDINLSGMGMDRLIDSRLNELYQQGKQSMIMEVAPEYAKDMTIIHKHFYGHTWISPKYTEMKDKANHFATARETFMLNQLKSGKHPDTHPDFYAGDGARFAPENFHTEAARIHFVGEAPLISRSMIRQIILFGIVGFVILTVVSIIIVLRIRRKRKATQELASHVDAMEPGKAV